MTDETILFKGSPSFATRLGSFTILSLIAVGAAILAYFVSVWLLSLTALALIGMLIEWIALRTRGYEVTSERIFLRRGIFNRRTDELELYRVRDLTLIEPLKLRLFGRGNLLVTTSDETTPNVLLEGIPDLHSLRERLRKCVESCRDRKRIRLVEGDLDGD